MSQCEFMCASACTAESVFLLDKEVTSTLCPQSSVHTSHTPSGSRGPCSVWSGAAPLAYLLPAVRRGLHLQSLPEGGKKTRINWGFLFVSRGLTPANLIAPSNRSCAYYWPYSRIKQDLFWDVKPWCKGVKSSCQTSKTLCSTCSTI